MTSSSSRCIYAQVVVGPPGSGKTTYCAGMQQYLRLLNRNAQIINLDPANENAVHDDDNAVLFDVCTHAGINLSSVMEEHKLGPNGALVYCIEFLQAHLHDILLPQIKQKLDNNNGNNNNNMYLLIDLPGQVELYTHSTSIQTILAGLVRELNLRLAMVQLIDAQYCTDAHKFIAAALLGTTCMIRLELPCVNVLSKVDLVTANHYGPLPLDFQFFTECREIERLVPFLENEAFNHDDNDDDIDDSHLDDAEYRQARTKRQAASHKYRKLHASLAEVVEDFGLLSFMPLDIQDATSVGRVLAKVDKCNGYVFTTTTATTEHEGLFRYAMSSENSHFEAVSQVRERATARMEQTDDTAV